MKIPGQLSAEINTLLVVGAAIHVDDADPLGKLDLLRATLAPALACAMHTLQATGDVRKVSLWLGHASIQTTEMYLRADPTEKLEALTAMGPPILKRGRFTVPDKLMAMLAEATNPRNYAE